MSEYDMSIHTNPDAAAWARFFMETAAKHGWRIEGPDEATMLGWFANAMCAALDARSRALSPPETPATEGGADEFCGAPGPFQAVCDLTADHDGLHRGWSTEGRVDWRTGTRLCPSGAHYEGNCACTGAASPASAPRETSAPTEAEDEREREYVVVQTVVETLAHGELPTCECGNDAVCVGVTEGRLETLAVMCDECCGHGNEDGWCVPLEKFYPSKRNALPPEAPASGTQRDLNRAAMQAWVTRGADEMMLLGRHLMAAAALQLPGVEPLPSTPEASTDPTEKTR